MSELKLYLLSGFLGAGKTTLLKQIIQNRSDLKIGVIMNEFGKISIDGPILENPDLEMIELTRGSIFCSCLKLSFAEALIKMADKSVDCVIVESSGLADPSNIGEILEAVQPYAMRPYQYQGCINIVDAYHFLEQVNDIETVLRQVETADLILINKIDRVSSERLEIIHQRLDQIGAVAERHETTYFDLDFKFIGEKLFKGESVRNEVSHNTPENKPKTFSMAFDVAVRESDFHAFLSSVAPQAYRMKGFVNLAEGVYQFDAVSSLIDFRESDNRFEQSTVVFISKIGPQLIRTVSEAWQKHLPETPMKLSN